MRSAAALRLPGAPERSAPLTDDLPASAAVTPFALAVRGVSKRFPGVHALDRVDLDVRPGEVHVVLGENGAGKSTLMKILSGVYPRDEGRVFIDGQEVELRGPRHAQALGISIIYQTFSQAPHLTVAENLFLGREPLTRWRTIDERKAQEMSRAVLARVGLAIDPQTPIKKLSVAQRQLVEIAKALSVDARIVIMDEPTSALTDRETRRLFGIIAALKAEGRAIIYISHRLEEVAQIGDRVTVLRDGKKVATVAVAEVPISRLITMMVGRDLELTALRETAAPGREVLRVQGLSRAGALRDIELSLHEGEILALAGLVGSGRTELARAIFGADPIDSGQIRVHQRDVQIRRPADAVGLGIGFVTEDRLHSGLLMTMSILQNSTLPSLRQFDALGGLFFSSVRERAASRRFVRELNVQPPALDRKVRYLSGGNQQKVVLAKWLMAQSQILIMDEPTQGIDVGAKEDVHRLMVEFTRERGGAILLISSDLPEVLRMSDRILVMRQGRIMGELARHEATEERVMQLAVGGAASGGPGPLRSAPQATPAGTQR
jgi:ribose transport system ATP-binding protein